MIPEYCEYLPNAALTSWVGCYWTRSAPDIAEFRELAGATPVPFFQSGGER